MYLIFLGLWILFNGSLTWEIFWIGVAVSAALFWFVCSFADYSIAKELRAYRNLIRIIRYAAHLVVEIVKSNLAVMHLILTQEEEPEPMLVTFETPLSGAATRALMANTITITPGTITVMLEDGTYTVHCLDSEFAQGIDESKFIEMLAQMEEN